MEIDKELIERIKPVRLVLFDIDGVMSDGRIIYDGEGREMKVFHARDGAGVVYLMRVGFEVGILTGRFSAPVDVRAKELGIKMVYQNIKRKLDVYEELLNSFDYKAEQIAFMGDDLMDLPVLRRVGLALAPANAVAEVKEVVHHVTEAKGGDGAVREAAELMIKAQGKWEQIFARYRE